MENKQLRTVRTKKQIIDGKRHCYRCDQWKPVAEFYRDPRAATGLRARCKKCDINEINQRHTNRLDRALRDLLIRHKINGRTGSKRRQVFTENEGCVTLDILNELWHLQDGKCAVTGVQLTHIQGQGFRIWTNVTLDRIDNDRGYARDNIRLVCRAVNYMKAAMSDEDLLKWAAMILNGPLANR